MTPELGPASVREWIVVLEGLLVVERRVADPGAARGETPNKKRKGGAGSRHVEEPCGGL